jgi:hypothetical protein
MKSGSKGLAKTLGIVLVVLVIIAFVVERLFVGAKMARHIFK